MSHSIEVNNLTISYRELTRLSIRRMKSVDGKPKKKGHVAVDDVSFDVEQGQIIGIIGRNGSGKSTLLRAIAGIFAPDTGTINTFGQTVSLLAIGVGFQNNLSGRENIFLSGLLLGFTKAQIDEQIERIIEFSEIGDFIDKPVKTYSSGMYSKLAFSITAVMEADIMLIDEVLSVGDSAFKKKSYNKMKELISHDERTVAIVSHNMATIAELCTNVLWLHDGKIREYGPTAKVLEAYEKSIKS